MLRNTYWPGVNSRPPTFSLFECFCIFCYLMRVPINDKCKHGIGGALLSNRISPLKDKSSNRFSRSRPKCIAKGIGLIKCSQILQTTVFGDHQKKSHLWLKISSIWKVWLFFNVKNCGNYFVEKRKHNGSLFVFW